MSDKQDISSKIKELVDKAIAGSITHTEAVQGITPDDIDAFSFPVASLQGDGVELISGLQKGASGVANGVAAFSIEEAKRLISEGKPVVLIRNETSAEDTKIIKQCSAVVTMVGGRTSHAVIICRGEGIPCLTGSGKINIDSQNKHLLDESGVNLVIEGGEISVDGNTGKIYKGEIPKRHILPPPELETLLAWADEASKVKTYVILDSIQGINKAINDKAKGVSILRTEHMFFEGERTPVFQQLILEPVENVSRRQELLDKLGKFQKDDFTKIFNEASLSPEAFPINIRLLDPPMHEFLPKEENWDSFITETGGSFSHDDIKKRCDALHEANPMMGLRGVRLLLKYPDIMRMQVKAIFEAAADSAKETGKSAIFGICLPMVENVQQVRDCKAIINKVRDEVIKEHGLSTDALQYKTSVMIETPAAAINAKDIAREANNFSFGTHDLTAATHASDRDSCLNPEIFISLSPETKFMVNYAAKQGKSGNKQLTMGICGDQGKDLETLKTICSEIPEINYVTANPQDIMKTRLSAGQAGIYASQFQGKYARTGIDSQICKVS